MGGEAPAGGGATCQGREGSTATGSRTGRYERGFWTRAKVPLGSWQSTSPRIVTQRWKGRFRPRYQNVRIHIIYSTQAARFGMPAARTVLPIDLQNSLPLSLPELFRLVASTSAFASASPTCASPTSSPPLYPPTHLHSPHSHQAHTSHTPPPRPHSPHTRSISPHTRHTPSAGTSSTRTTCPADSFERRHCARCGTRDSGALAGSARL